MIKKHHFTNQIILHIETTPILALFCTSSYSALIFVINLVKCQIANLVLLNMSFSKLFLVVHFLIILFHH